MTFAPHERKRRKDAGHPRWEDRDYYVLHWIGTQGIIRFDQLQHVLGRESPALEDWNALLSPSATRNAIDRWETKRLVNSDALLPGEPKYYWLSNAGFAFAELELSHYRPKASELPYRLACNQARLHIEGLNQTDPQEFGDFMECDWISERELSRDNPDSQAHVPSGAFETQTRGTLAIEVVIAFKEEMQQIMRAYAQGQLGAYSEVWYYALSEPLARLDETRETVRRSGIDVSRIYTFKADNMLIPPPRPKRVER